MWQPTDKFSWVRSTFPGAGEACLLDQNYQKTPAYTAVANLLRSAAAGVGAGRGVGGGNGNGGNGGNGNGNGNGGARGGSRGGGNRATDALNVEASGDDPSPAAISPPAPVNNGGGGDPFALEQQSSPPATPAAAEEKSTAAGNTVPMTAGSSMLEPALGGACLAMAMVATSMLFL